MAQLFIMSIDASFDIKAEDFELRIEPGSAVLVPASTNEFQIRNVKSNCWISMGLLKNRTFI